MWFYGLLESTTSYTWAGAQNLYRHLINHTNSVLKTEQSQLRVGDLVIVEPSAGGVWHAMIVAVKGTSDLLMNYHTHNTHRKSLNEIKRTAPPGKTFRHLFVGTAYAAEALPEGAPDGRNVVSEPSTIAVQIWNATTEAVDCVISINEPDQTGTVQIGNGQPVVITHVRKMGVVGINHAGLRGELPLTSPAVSIHLHLNASCPGFVIATETVITVGPKLPAISQTQSFLLDETACHRLLAWIRSLHIPDL